MTDYRKYFDEMRHDKRFHLGMGDIRITNAMQDEIAAENERLRERLAEAEQINTDWFKANGPGGWIDDQRKRLTEAERLLRDAVNTRIEWDDLADKIEAFMDAAP